MGHTRRKRAHDALRPSAIRRTPGAVAITWRCARCGAPHPTVECDAVHVLDSGVDLHGLAAAVEHEVALALRRSQPVDAYLQLLDAIESRISRRVEEAPPTLARRQALSAERGASLGGG
jgi:hypothetical protein